MDEVIVVRQLPIIEERLKQISDQIQEKVSAALAVECTEDNLKTVKSIRAELNKDFQALEASRKEVKNKILAPYNRLEAVYKPCITDIFNASDKNLKQKIDEVENGLKAQKRAEVAAYFDEYLATKNIDFITLDDAGINITLSASIKSLKGQARVFIDKVCDELALIETQENAPEVLVEYKRSLNVAQAITTVANRHKAIEEECRRYEQMQEAEAAKIAAVHKVEAVIAAEQPEEMDTEPLSAPVVEPMPESEPDSEEVYELQFSVTGTLDKLRVLKAFLVEGGYQFEQL